MARPQQVSDEAIVAIIEELRLPHRTPSGVAVSVPCAPRSSCGRFKASEVLGTTQAQMSALRRLRPVSISVGRLMEFLTVLGQDVEVKVKPAPPRKAGHMSVVVEPA